MVALKMGVPRVAMGDRMNSFDKVTALHFAAKDKSNLAAGAAFSVPIDVRISKPNIESKQYLRCLPPMLGLCWVFD